MTRYLSIPCAVLDAPDGLAVRTLAPLPLREWGLPFVVPAGFISDGMSVPRILWRLLGAKIGSRTLGPSIVHDYLYQTHILTRSKADAWYRRALVANGYPPSLAWTVWLGLRIAGASHW